MKKIFILTLAVVIGIFTTAWQDPKLKLYADRSQSGIVYYMNHPLHKWSGESKMITSIVLTDQNLDQVSKVVVSVKISSFDSQNANRDSHMIEAAEALKYPNNFYEQYN
jgi:hypothetical protein